MRRMLIVFIWLIAIISVFSNMEYEQLIKEKDQYINELETKIEERDNTISDYERALNEKINIYFDECYLEN